MKSKMLIIIGIIFIVVGVFVMLKTKNTVPVNNSLEGEDLQELLPEVFTGNLEEGHIYQIRWPLGAVTVPHHHAYNIEWKNLAKFPELEKTEIKKAVVFKVIEVTTYKVEGQNRWNDQYTLEILGVKQTDN